MKIRTILDGNAFYEIDEECMEKRKKSMTEETEKEGKKTEEIKEERRKNE